MEWQKFEKKNKRQSTQALLLYICLLFLGFSSFCHSACVCPTALKLSCVTNFVMLFLVISSVDEMQFMLINSRRTGEKTWPN